MKSVLLNFVLKKKVKYLLFISFLTLKGMDSPLQRRLQNKISQDASQGPIFLKTIKAWDNEKLIQNGQESTRHIPQSMIIIPGGKGVLYTAPGETRFVCIETMVHNDPHLLYRHSNDTYHPLIAAAMKSGNVLILASILNRIGQQPEYVLSKHRVRKSNNTSHNIFSGGEFKFLPINSNVKTIGAATNWDDSNVQAIALSSNGEYLAIGFSNFVQLTDLVTETSYRSIFPQTVSPHAFVVDVSTPISNFLDQKESHVASVNNKGHIDCKRFTDDELFMNVKNVPTGDRIENVHLMPATKEVWYVTEKGQVNTIDFRTFLEHCDDEIKKRMVSYHEGSKASVDQGSEQATIHWSNNPQAEDMIRLRINVYRESNTGAQSFILTLPDLFPNAYNCIGTQGQKTSAPICITSAVVRGNIVAGFLSSGEIAFWKLPEKHQAPVEDKVKGIDIADTLKRGRSLSQTAPISANEKRKSARKSSHPVPKLTIFRSKESLKSDKPDKSDAKNNASPTESPRKKAETPRKKKSMPSSSSDIRTVLDPVYSSDESKFENARNEDIYNDFHRNEND